jgi:hypothetical protein
MCLRADCNKYFKEKITNGYRLNNAFLGSYLALGISLEILVIVAPESSLPL